MTFIVKPLVTEKMTKLTDKSSVAKTYKVKGQERTKKAETKYGFIVLPEANKLEIKKEIEARYNVTVLDVTCWQAPMVSLLFQESNRWQAQYLK